jgi:hypothetical protein
MPRLIRFTVSCACIRAQGHTLVRKPGVESGFPDQISYHVTRLLTKKRLMPQVSYYDSSNRLWASILCVNVHISTIGLNKAMKRCMGKLTYRVQSLERTSGYAPWPTTQQASSRDLGKYYCWAGDNTKGEAFLLNDGKVIKIPLVSKTIINVLE